MNDVNKIFKQIRVILATGSSVDIRLEEVSLFAHQSPSTLSLEKSKYHYNAKLGKSNPYDHLKFQTASLHNDYSDFQFKEKVNILLKQAD